MSLSVVFVGSLTVRKSVITILKAAKILKNKGYEDRITFSIIGDGPQMSKLNRFVKDNGLNNISFKGNMKNQQVSQFLVNQDVLVLPSIHDGWGAVINEALQAGLYAICSDRCGAKELFVARPHLGSCFKLGDSYGLSLLLEKCLLDISNLRENYPERRRWAKNTISGDIIGKYLVDCICGEDVIAPWMRCDSFQFEITDKSLLSR